MVSCVYSLTLLYGDRSTNGVSEYPTCGGGLGAGRVRVQPSTARWSALAESTLGLVWMVSQRDCMKAVARLLKSTMRLRSFRRRALCCLCYAALGLRKCFWCPT